MSNQERQYTLDEVIETSKFYLRLWQKYDFVRHCYSARKSHNFPIANLLEHAILEFEIANRDYQANVSEEVRKRQDEVEDIIKLVKEIKDRNSRPEERKSFSFAQQTYSGIIKGRRK